jgi:O-antigen/teichoic acid export membrane protein
LAGGTTFAQGLGILALPFLTRIYTPEEFGVLGVFTALLGITSVIACLRYEIAIPLPESDKSAANLIALSLLCLAVTTLLVTAVALPFSGQIAALMNTPILSKHLWLLPFAVAVTGAYGVFQYWATRKKAFKRIARTRVEQAVGGVSTQLLLGWAGAGTLGLIAGQIVSNGAGFFGLARRAYTEDREALRGINSADMKSVAIEYDRFPKYSTFESLANTAGVQLPMILIASFASGVEVGYLMLTMRIMQAPMGLIGSSISQVYLSRAVEEHRNGSLGDFTARTIGGLAKIGVGPIIFAGIIAPSVFGLIFGAKWGRAGELLAWMSPWFVLQFLVSPVSMVFHVTSNQRSALVLQVIGLLLRVLMVLAAGFFLTSDYVSEFYALSGCLFYFLYLLVVCRVANISTAQIFSVFKNTLPIAIVWILVAITVVFFVARI